MNDKFLTFKDIDSLGSLAKEKIGGQILASGEFNYNKSFEVKCKINPIIRTLFTYGTLDRRKIKRLKKRKRLFLKITREVLSNEKED